MTKGGCIAGSWQPGLEYGWRGRGQSDMSPIPVTVAKARVSAMSLRWYQFRSGFLLIILPLVALILAAIPVAWWYTNHAIRLDTEAAARRVLPPRPPSEAEMVLNAAMKMVLSRSPPPPQHNFHDELFAPEHANKQQP